MWPRLLVKRAWITCAGLALLMTLIMLSFGGISAAQRDVPISPTPQSSDGLRGVPVIDTAGDVSSPQAFTGCADVTEIPKLECQALVKLYNSTDGPNWTDSSNWLATNEPCAWKGVSCTNNQVTSLNLFGNNLQGTIPIQLGHLAGLTYLNLVNNELTGEIPSQLGNLTNLTQIYLGFNALTGHIPSEFGNLTQLTNLALGANKLTGAIPEALTQLTNLTSMSFDYNQLTGTIPSDIGNLTGLTFLGLGPNRLTGTIPSGIGNLTGLTYLTLDNNQLTGAIPVTFGQLTNLTILRMNGNDLSGTIPTGLGNLTNLNLLFLDGNQLSGAIPTEFGNLTKLVNLTLHNNQLTGSIPATLGNLTSMRSLSLQDNQLTGSIPATLGNLSTLYSLRLNNNELTGAIPSQLNQISTLRDLNLANNQLQGVIPAALASLSPDILLDIRFNALMANDPGIINFLNNRQPNWQYYQTVPPSDVNLSVDAFQDLILSWSPVPEDVANLNGWYYEVACGTQSGGPYTTVSLLTKNIYASQLTFSALIDDTYFCAVRTFSSPQPDDDTGFWSEYSAEVSGTIVNPTPIVRGDTFNAPVVMDNLNAQFWGLNAEDATADPTLPIPSCATNIDPDVHQSIIYQLPVDLSGDLAVISGGPRYFKDRADPDTADTVLVIYKGVAFPTPATEVACDDNSGPVGGGSNILLTTYEPGEIYTAVVWMRDVGDEGLVFDVDQTQILSTNSDFSVVNPNNAKLPKKWQLKNSGKSKLVCEVVGASSPAFSTPCAFQLVASGQQPPVLQQVIQSAAFPAKISSGEFQGAAYLKRMNTSGTARLSIEITYKNGQKVKKVTPITARGCANDAECGEPYQLVKTPLLTVQKAVKSVRIFISLNGNTGKLRVDDVILYYIP